MQANDAKTFIELAQHLEQTLKASTVFYSVASTAHQEGTATLVSMELTEVRFLKHGTSGVYMLFEAVFNSANTTVLARRDLPLLVQLGVYDLELGSSTARDKAGNTSRTITCQVARPLLTGGLSDEVEKLCGNKASKAVAAAVKAVRATPAYKTEVLAFQTVEAEIKKLTKRLEKHQGRMLALEAAAQQNVLPVSSKIKGKLPYQVFIA